jgi:hypothetical protein
MGLLLTAADIGGPLAWRWLLSDEDSGELVADRRVNLDAASGEARAPDWTPLVFVLRRVLAGERGLTLLAGLDLVDTAIVREVLARIGEGT